MKQCCTLKMKVVVNKWDEISQHEDTQAGPALPGRVKGRGHTRDAKPAPGVLWEKPNRELN